MKVRDIYNLFIDTINKELREAKINISEAKVNIGVIENSLDRFKDKIKVHYIDLDKLKASNYSDLSMLSKTKIDGVIIDSYKSKDTRIVRDLLRILKSKIIDIEKRRRDIKRLTKYKIDYTTFRRVLGYFNLELSKYILDSGYSYTIPRGGGKIFIHLKKRNFDDSKGNTKVINWKESLDLLKTLCKNVPEANRYLQQYKNKEINKNEFIDKANSIIKDDWIVYYYDDKSLWWKWSKTGCNIKNKTLYSFTPTNFINTKNRSQIEFTENCKSKRDILDSKQLGMRDKLFALNRFDSLHYLNYMEDATL